MSNKKTLKLASINSNLSKAVKDAIYLSDFYIYELEIDYVYETLENWSSINRFDFLYKIEIIVLEKISKIESDIKINLNSRKHIITEIFELFSLQHYSGMITLSLSQIDGIMKEITKKNGFYNSNPGNKKENPNRIKYLDDDFFIDTFSQLELLDINNRNEYELFKKDISDMSLLNRHSILHGESKEFGTKTNAIKTILLLTFISELYASNKE